MPNLRVSGDITAAELQALLAATFPNRIFSVSMDTSDDESILRTQLNILQAERSSYMSQSQAIHTQQQMSSDYEYLRNGYMKLKTSYTNSIWKECVPYHPQLNCIPVINYIPTTFSVNYE
jgi:hypothetical protein